MLGIEPKFHTSLVERMKYYHHLLKETEEDSYIQAGDASARVSQLIELYEDYLNNKKELERSIKNYRDHHQNLQKLLTSRIRYLRRKTKQR